MVRRRKGKRQSKAVVRKKHTRRTQSRSEAARNRALAALSDMRRGSSLSHAARENGVSLRTVQRYVGRALVRDRRGGRVRAAKSDRLIRALIFPASSGDVPQRIRGSRAATRLSEFFHNRDSLLHRKMPANEFEAKWRGVRIAGQEVFADTATIFLRAHFGDLKVENLYASTRGTE